MNVALRLSTAGSGQVRQAVLQVPLAPAEFAARPLETSPDHEGIKTGHVAPQVGHVTLWKPAPIVRR